MTSSASILGDAVHSWLVNFTHTAAAPESCSVAQANQAHRQRPRCFSDSAAQRDIGSDVAVRLARLPLSSSGKQPATALLDHRSAPEKVARTIRPDVTTSEFVGGRRTGALMPHARAVRS